ncbi:MAG: GntR family transcriptional regulator [Halieaceae bacterium]|jgi:DNA-binding GntR family transcriptional regulator|uniref:GntR family transcriptional regulator n=1 Tax=Haliea alexandrii TaxID=2448162 RepID=UPI000F0B9AA1|nr:GntR family transcriptional regulator [Haliea alexandrii]MCR9185868.1 GntR family transcriptional regulator [Halieaceae bacterium]
MSGLQKTELGKSKKRVNKGGNSPDIIVNWIQEGLYNGRYVPGQKLVEADLIATLNISRGPVREALKRLHGKGILRQIPFRGAHIRAFSRKEAADLLTVLEPLTSLMAKLAAEAVAAGVSTQPLADILQWIEKFQRGSVNDVTFVGKRQHLYQTLMELGGNVELPYIMPTAQLHLLRLQSFPYLDNEQRQQVIDEYLRIIDAVLNGDAIRAARVGKQHVQAAKRRVASLPDEVFPDFRVGD